MLNARNTVTIGDVARRAGVSVATVSRVINEAGYVSPELTDAVWEAIRELGYRRDALARGLKTRTSGTIGVIVSNILNPFYTALVRGIEDTASELGFNMVLCNTDEDPAKILNYLRVLHEHRRDGIVLASAPEATPQGRTELKSIASYVPVVLVDRRSSLIDASTVLVDNVSGARDAVAHLIELGHRRIGIVTGPYETTTGRDRLLGYRLAHEEYNIPVDENLIRSTEFITLPAQEATQELLMIRPRPTALFMGNNLMTIGALCTIRQLGLRITDDISIVGFDDPEWSEIISPTLTAVAQPTYELGVSAMKLLHKRIQGDEDVTGELVLSCKLVVRDSTGPCKE